MTMDRWDGVGVTGALAIGAGVWALTSWPWAVIFWGALLGALYIVRELRA